MGYNKYGGFSKSSIRRSRKASNIVTNIMFSAVEGIVKDLGRNNTPKYSGSIKSLNNNSYTNTIPPPRFVYFMDFPLKIVSNDIFQLYRNNLSDIKLHNSNKRQQIKKLEIAKLKIINKRVFWGKIKCISQKRYKKYSELEKNNKDEIIKIYSSIIDEKVNIEAINLPQFNILTSSVLRICESSFFYIIFGIDKLISTKPTIRKYSNSHWYDRKELNYIKSFDKIIIDKSNSGFGCDRFKVIFYPAFILITSNNNSDYAFLKYEEIIILYSETEIREDISYSKKEDVVSTVAWEHSRADGNPDKRYKSNKLISIVSYANLTLKNNLGLKIELIVSDATLAKEFVKDFKFYSSFISKNIKSPPIILD